MLEKRNVVRRNLTGALTLGAGAGLLAALPDAAASLFMSDVSFSAWFSMVLLFFFDGVVTGGFLGLARGLFQLFVERFSESHAQARAWTLWGRRALAAGWAGTLFPSLPFGMLDRFLFTFVLAFLAASLLPAAFAFCIQSTQRRDRLPRLAACIALLLAAGAVSTSSAWGAPGWFQAPGFWFMTGFLLHTGALYLGVAAIRAFSRSRGRIFSRFASPLTVGAMLLAAMLGGSTARRMLAESGDAQLRQVSLLAYGLMEGPDKPANPAAAQKSEPSTSSDEIPAIQATKAKTDFGAPWAKKDPAPAWRIDEGRSLLIVTAERGENPQWTSGACYTGGWRTGGGLEMDLGSLFTGHHLPMWALTAPERPAPGPPWPWLFSRVKLDVVRYGALKLQHSEYFREIPEFGFPEPFQQEGILPVDAFLRTRDLVNKPFFAWVHQPESAKDWSALLDASQKDGFVVLWLTLREDETVDACIFDPQNPRPWTQQPAAFSLAGILPSLMPAPGYRTEFPGTGFPEGRHPRVRMRQDGIEEARRFDARRLYARIRKQAGNAAFPREISAWVDFLDSRICRGRMTPSEIRRLFSRVQAIQKRPEISRRLDLLRWRLGFPDAPPLWVVQREWSLRLAKLGLFEPPADVEPILAAWISALQGSRAEAVQKYCPGYPHAARLSLGGRQEKGN